MTDPGQLVDRGRALQRQILRAGGPPPEHAARWRAACRTIDQAEQALRGGLGIAWFLAWPAFTALMASVGFLGYLVARTMPAIEEGTRTAIRGFTWVLIGGAAMMMLGAVKKSRRKAAA